MKTIRIVFGAIFIIVGLICLPQIIKPSVYATIGGLIGISLVSFLPAYFLLREKKETETRTNHDKQTSNIDHALGIFTIENHSQGAGQHYTASPTEDNYENLFEELKAKCHPKQFMEPYDHEKVKLANELYARITEAKDDTKRLEELRAEAMEKLDVKFSSKNLYEKLMRVTNPANFMNPYDAEKVAIANDYYQKVQQYAGNVIGLEAIWKEVEENNVFSPYISNVSIPKGRGEEGMSDVDKLTAILLIVFLVLVCVIIVIIKYNFIL